MGIIIPGRSIWLEQWIIRARAEVLAEVEAGTPLIEAISFHTSTDLWISLPVIVRMKEWRDMATEA